MRPSSRSIRFSLAAVLIASAFAGLSTRAHADAGDTHRMQQAASVGTVDEKDRDKVEFRAGRARLFPSIDRGRATIRYNVDFYLTTNTVDIRTLKARFRDNGPDAQVIVKLRRYDMDSGVTETVMTLDSNDYPASNEYQLQGISNYDDYLWYRNEWVYWLEVKLIKTGSGGTPELGAVMMYAREKV